MQVDEVEQPHFSSRAQLQLSSSLSLELRSNLGMQWRSGPDWDCFVFVGTCLTFAISWPETWELTKSVRKQISKSSKFAKGSCRSNRCEADRRRLSRILPACHAGKSVIARDVFADSHCQETRRMRKMEIWLHCFCLQHGWILSTAFCRLNFQVVHFCLCMWMWFGVEVLRGFAPRNKMNYIELHWIPAMFIHFFKNLSGLPWPKVMPWTNGLVQVLRKSLIESMSALKQTSVITETTVNELFHSTSSALASTEFWLGRLCFARFGNRQIHTNLRSNSFNTCQHMPALFSTDVWQWTYTCCVCTSCRMKYVFMFRFIYIYICMYVYIWVCVCSNYDDDYSRLICLITMPPWLTAICLTIGYLSVFWWLFDNCLMAYQTLNMHNFISFCYTEFQNLC